MGAAEALQSTLRQETIHVAYEVLEIGQLETALY
jgi:hypothetical protein